MNRRLAAIGGIAGPAAFIAAWALLGADARRRGYAPTRDPISRLAAVGAPTRAEMSAGFIAFSAGLSLYAASARENLSPGVAALAAANAFATLGVAAFPLGGSGGDHLHAVAAGAGYITLAALPALGADVFARDDQHSAARASRVLALAIAAALTMSAAGTSHAGFFQRLGLTLGDAWIIATSLWILRGANTRDR